MSNVNLRKEKEKVFYEYHTNTYEDFTQSDGNHKKCMEISQNK